MTIHSSIDMANSASYSEPSATQNSNLPSISIVGLGYVGAVSTACLSGLGHEVIGVDLDPQKVASIAAGKSPIHELHLAELLSAGVAQNLVRATTELQTAILETDITFVSVGTPTAEGGGCDMRAINAVATIIGQALLQKQEFHTIVMRCSIPPGTTCGVMVPIIESISGKSAGKDFGVCFNPEFLREGTAVEDFHNPPKTVIGASDEKTASIIAALYAPVDANPIISTIEVAEMVKYVDNVWHATKVCFANEIGRICKPLDVDSHQVMDIFVQDTKLNVSPYYLKPGFAFGGSCLPKEVRAVSHLANELDVSVPLIDSLSPSNTDQIDTAIEALRASGAKCVAFLGVAFKPGTDDLRESPILNVIEAALADGIEVQLYDTAIEAGDHLDAQLAYLKHSCPHLQRTLSNFSNMLRDDAEAMLNNCDTIVVSQKNAEFQGLVSKYMEGRHTIDVVRLFENKPTDDRYFGIGW